MIRLKSDEEIARILVAGEIVAGVLELVESKVEPGTTTALAAPLSMEPSYSYTSRSSGRHMTKSGPTIPSSSRMSSEVCVMRAPTA